MRLRCLVLLLITVLIFTSCSTEPDSASGGVDITITGEAETIWVEVVSPDGGTLYSTYKFNGTGTYKVSVPAESYIIRFFGYEDGVQTSNAELVMDGSESTPADFTAELVKPDVDHSLKVRFTWSGSVDEIKIITEEEELGSFSVTEGETSYKINTVLSCPEKTEAEILFYNDGFLVGRYSEAIILEGNVRYQDPLSVEIEDLADHRSPSISIVLSSPELLPVEMENISDGFILKSGEEVNVSAAIDGIISYSWYLNNEAEPVSSQDSFILTTETVGLSQSNESLSQILTLKALSENGITYSGSLRFFLDISETTGSFET